jgi:intracellular sulfur oxidation DsrE/DsrF family protein
MKAIFHVDDPERWSLCIANARNMAAFYQLTRLVPDRDRRERSCGPAARAAYSGRSASRAVQRSRAGRVSFAACNNALNNLKISAEALFPFVTVVPAGVVELAQKQTDGYAYIKP